MSLDPDLDVLPPPRLPADWEQQHEFEDALEDSLFDAYVVGDLGFEDGRAGAGQPRLGDGRRRVRVPLRDRRARRPAGAAGVAARARGTQPEPEWWRPAARRRPGRPALVAGPDPELKTAVGRAFATLADGDDAAKARELVVAAARRQTARELAWSRMTGFPGQQPPVAEVLTRQQL